MDPALSQTISAPLETIRPRCPSFLLQADMRGILLIKPLSLEMKPSRLCGEPTEVVVKRHKKVLPAPALKYTFSCKVFRFLDLLLDHNLASVSLCWDLPFQVIWSLFPLQKLLRWGEHSLSEAFLHSVDKVQPQPLVNQSSHLEHEQSQPRFNKNQRRSQWEPKQLGPGGFLASLNVVLMLRSVAKNKCSFLEINTSISLLLVAAKSVPLSTG